MRLRNKICTTAPSISRAIRLESYEAVKRLNAKGADVATLTGDSQAVAESVAKDLGIDTVSAHVLPEEKAEKNNSCSRKANAWPWWVTAPMTRRPC
jgi:Cu2+-exporting ATPase